MPTDKKANAFFFHESPVGYFHDDSLPNSAGCYRYVPYRTVGHHRLHGALRAQGPQRCHYVTANCKRYFTVVACPGYGLLQLADFDSSDPL
jgi:hypothetical protein